MKMLARSVLVMEIFVIGFAVLVAKDLTSTNLETEAYWLAGIIALLAFLAAGGMKSKWGWILGWITQFALIGYGFFVFTMFFLGALFMGLWVAAIVIGRKGEAARAAFSEDKKTQQTGVVSNSSSSAQRTLILVKPDGVRRGLVGEVIARVERKGYKISALRMLQADRNTLAAHYAEHEGKPFYEPLMEFMLSGPIVAMIAEGERVIEGFRTIAGTTDPTTAAPGSIRGDLARDQGTKVVQNIVHGSDSTESAEREIKIFFPNL